ncbi:uncharacterized protein LOC129293240 [Prosopis cineraria]|uniref:uncharacterized protein LOC129293240 n=1 Tax=Prosopis cineraria TaxID=364024 RepID=UPI00240F96F5|nr:uncharacterized protein LOC129293240 [Prosopis cineraria]
MALSSFSIIPSSSSFPSISNLDSPSTSSPTRIRAIDSSRRCLKFIRPLQVSSLFTSLPFSSIVGTSSSSKQIVENESADKFLQNASMADFLRFKRGIDGGSGELQTAIVSYRKKFPWSLLYPFLQVDLVSTIHIADKEYFLALQKVLQSYDCVLYEMVASRESIESRSNTIPKTRVRGSGTKGFNILGCIQRWMARILMLDFQLDSLSYQSANWYHADLDYETFKLLQLEKGESFFSFARDMTLRSTKAMLQPASSVPEDLGPWRSKLLWASRVLPMPLVGLVIIGSVCADAESQASAYPEIEALSRLDFGAAIKVFLAKRLTTELTEVTADVEEKSVIIGERNKAAVDSLRKAIQEGHNKIAILYGGGHMPDLGRRLREQYDLEPCRVQWVTAWSIKKRNLNTSSFPFLRTMAQVSGWPWNRYQTLAWLIFSSVLALDLLFWELFFRTSVDWVSQIGTELVEYLG